MNKIYNFKGCNNTILASLWLQFKTLKKDINEWN